MKHTIASESKARGKKMKRRTTWSNDQRTYNSEGYITKMGKEKVTILIPCYNEEQGIAKVLDEIPYYTLKKYGFETKVIVIDNNSSDRTSEIAESKGAYVIFEPAKGKGNAIRKAFDCIGSDAGYVVMLDGDSTYDPKEMLRLIEPIANDFCDVVIGSRLGGKVTQNAFKAQNRLANWMYTFLVRCFYGANITDVLSGYFAWRADVIEKMRGHLKSDGFSIEMEMVSKMVKLNYSVYSVPITYRIREGDTKLESIKDGFKILFTLFQNFFWSAQQESPGTLENDHSNTLSGETSTIEEKTILVGTKEITKF